MKELDVRGLACPEPLMIVKDELKNGNEDFTVLINEAHTKRNIESFLEDKKAKFNVEDKNDEFVITVNR